MRVAVYLPERAPYSMKFCAENIMEVLRRKYAVEFIVFKNLAEIPIANTDIYWDPRCGGGIAPPLVFKKTKKPLILTVHGMAMFTLPLNTFYFTPKQKIKGQFKRWKERLKWKLMMPYIQQVMTVSHYTKKELMEAVNFPEKKITAVWNGLDHTKFKPAEKRDNVAPYFLTVISYQKKKNFERLLEAYQRLDASTRPKLIALIKPYLPTMEVSAIQGLEIINTPVDEEKIIDFYQQATAVVFVSLHEGFGLPIVEAMACGVPVLTSNTTSCKEIAGDAALLVNPLSVEEISSAMKQLQTDVSLRNQFRNLGLERAKQFNWETSADKFYDMLKKA